MTSPLLSIVIPTRNRAGTLVAAMRSCLTQDFADFELLVVDNASTQETRDVVESFSDQRIRYVRHEEPLAMTDNWNAALSATLGRWVTFLGDDDGMMPGALSRLIPIVESTKHRAIRWDYAVYLWPDMPLGGDRLSVPLNFGEPVEVSGLEAIRLMAEQPDAGPRGPSVYYGLVHRSLIDEALTSGPVFEGQIPDYYSGTLFAALSGTFLQLSEPITIAGLSGRSNGVAHLIEKEGAPVRDDFSSLNAAAGHEFHGNLPNLHLTCIYVLDAILRVRDRLNLDTAGLAPDPEQIVDVATRTLWRSGDEFKSEVAELRRYITANGIVIPPTWEARFERPESARSPFIPNNGEPGVVDGAIIVDTSSFGVQDVSDAGHLAAGLRDSCSPFARELTELRSASTTLKARIAEQDSQLARLGRDVDRLSKKVKTKNDQIRGLRRTPSRRLARKVKHLLGR